MHKYGFGNDASALRITDEGLTLVVADGVGGSWLAGKFSRVLVENIASSNAKSSKDKIIDGYIKSREGWSNFNNHPASTVCVANICKGYVDLAWIGDAGARVFRKGKLEYETKDGLHGFNKPFQITIQELVEIDPSEIYCKIVHLEEEDTIFIASDGLFDNLCNDKLGNISVSYSSVQEMVSNTVTEAVNASQDKDKITPFNIKQSNASGGQYIGGKEDDITAMIAIYKG